MKAQPVPKVRRLLALGSVLAGALVTLLFFLSPGTTLAAGSIFQPTLWLASSLTSTFTTSTTESVSRGTRGTTLDESDPINMATGEYYFFLDLFRLDGPLPLDYRLYYGSQRAFRNSLGGRC